MSSTSSAEIKPVLPFTTGSKLKRRSAALWSEPSTRPLKNHSRRVIRRPTSQAPNYRAALRGGSRPSQNRPPELIYCAHVEGLHPKCHTASGTQHYCDVPPLGSIGAFLP